MWCASTNTVLVLVLMWRTTGWESASEISCAMSCCSWISSSTSWTWSALLHAEHSTSTRSVHSLHKHTAPATRIVVGTTRTAHAHRNWKNYNYRAQRNNETRVPNAWAWHSYSSTALRVRRRVDMDRHRRCYVPLVKIRRNGCVVHKRRKTCVRLNVFHKSYDTQNDLLVASVQVCKLTCTLHVRVHALRGVSNYSEGWLKIKWVEAYKEEWIRLWLTRTSCLCTQVVMPLFNASVHNLCNEIQVLQTLEYDYIREWLIKKHHKK